MVGLLVGGSMFISTTGAVAATPSAVSAHRVDPWAALSVMSAGAPAAALCGAAATAGQAPAGCVLPAVDQAAVATPPPPTPVPPVEPVGGGLGISPLWLALGALALGAAVYFLFLDDDDDEAESPD